MRSSIDRDDPSLFAPRHGPRPGTGGPRLDFQNSPTRTAAARKPVPHPIAHPPRSFIRLWPLPMPVQWTTLGFLGGAAFWHFVGFWTFMSHIVFTTPEAERRPGLAASPVMAGTQAGLGAAIETGSLQRLEKLTAPKFEPSCIAIARDPITGDARQSPCPRLKSPMKLNTASNRQDVLSPPKPETHEATSLALDPSTPLHWPP